MVTFAASCAWLAGAQRPSRSYLGGLFHFIPAASDSPTVPQCGDSRLARLALIWILKELDVADA
jgi:hypothetical protein